MLNNAHLRKLLMLFYARSNLRRSKIREDIRAELESDPSGGGDFYGPFWADAKNHVFGQVDLHEMVNERIESNDRRSRLYPQLRDGFFLWWNDRRRWTNEPFQPGQSLKASFNFPSLAATVKVDNVLSVRDGLNVEHIIYPYFSEEPILESEAACLGLWLLSQAFPEITSNTIRILDVIRGQSFSLERTPLIGNEGEKFEQMYSVLLQEREELRRGYG